MRVTIVHRLIEVQLVFDGLVHGLEIPYKIARTRSPNLLCGEGSANRARGRGRMVMFKLCAESSPNVTSIG